MSSNAPHIRIGTRGSDLALWQAHHVRDLLQARGATVEIVVLKTRGDQIQNVSFDKMEGKGFFTKEIEQALLEGNVDLAVHSHKDLETTPPAGLVVAAVPMRMWGEVEDMGERYARSAERSQDLRSCSRTASLANFMGSPTYFFSRYATMRSTTSLGAARVPFSHVFHLSPHPHRHPRQRPCVVASVPRA